MHTSHLEETALRWLDTKPEHRRLDFLFHSSYNIEQPERLNSIPLAAAQPYESSKCSISTHNSVSNKADRLRAGQQGVSEREVVPLFIWTETMEAQTQSRLGS